MFLDFTPLLFFFIFLWAPKEPERLLLLCCCYFLFFVFCFSLLCNTVHEYGGESAVPGTDRLPLWTGEREIGVCCRKG